jgi:hypothetical protein
MNLYYILLIQVEILPISQILQFYIFIESINKLLITGYKLNYQLNFSQLGGEVENGNSAYFPKKAIIVYSKNALVAYNHCIVCTRIIQPLCSGLTLPAPDHREPGSPPRKTDTC